MKMYRTSHWPQQAVCTIAQVGLLRENQLHRGRAEQFEDLLHQVWLCEREWDFDDLINLACDRHHQRPAP